MKLIDRTPLQDEKGEIGIIQRIQGTLKYGLNWYPELEAQKFVLGRLERGLVKGYVAIRNHTLGASGIVVPLVLVGPAGIFAIYVTHLRGQYQAKGNNWGTTSGKTFKPASINLLKRTEMLSRALQAFIERQEVSLPKAVEPVIMAANPGLYVDSARPLARVVMADAIERWAASLSKGAPVLTVETAYELADRIINPRVPKKEKPKQEEPEDELPSYLQPDENSYLQEDGEPSRASVIFAEAENAQPLDINDLGFAYEEDAELELPAQYVESDSEAPAPAQHSMQKRYFGMTVPQLAILGGLLLVWICVMIVFAIIISLNS